jgi:hypothetical protein
VCLCGVILVEDGVVCGGLDVVCVGVLYVF